MAAASWESPGYLHTGSVDDIEDVIGFYIATAALARAGLLRNGAPQLAEMVIDERDIAPLSAFLRALDEDYT